LPIGWCRVWGSYKGTFVSGRNFTFEGGTLARGLKSLVPDGEDSMTIESFIPDAVASEAGMDMNGLNYSLQAPRLDWGQAVRAATARLDEGWELPETKCDPAVEEEFAALLCAYGVLGDEVGRIDCGLEWSRASDGAPYATAGYTHYIKK
jgi:hypothetical protein